MYDALDDACGQKEIGVIYVPRVVESPSRMAIPTVID
jgi:hypothetical protein